MINYVYMSINFSVKNINFHINHSHNKEFLDGFANRRIGILNHNYYDILFERSNQQETNRFYK